MNRSGSVHLRETDTVSEFRAEIQKKYELDASSFLVTKVLDNIVKRIFDGTAKIEDVISEERVLILYEIPASLNPQIPPKEKCGKYD